MTTTSYAYRTLNVFTLDGDRLSGNPLCVFEDGRGLSDTQMQALARQLNLSETTFVLPPSAPGTDATARVRIFTPTFEMPFAGHPTLGTAHVVRDLTGAGDRVALEMKAGVVGVTAKGDVWTLRAVQAPRTKALAASRSELAAMLGLAEEALASSPLWVDTGAEQLVIPLVRPEDVRAAKPSRELLERHAFSISRQEAMAYVWARGDAGEITARFFFVSGGGVVEDPATGSACANLGGWFLATGAALPFAVSVRQGDAVGRPSRLGLRVDAERNVFVEGGVVELGRGVLRL
jgi:trans-2,3-dihydro-3-hydroxyanthranilate isomerase